MYIGGILGTILVIALIVYFVRRIWGECKDKWLRRRLGRRRHRLRSSGGRGMEVYCPSWL